MQLGFVGLGAMGLPMTRHLLEAGHRVTVSSRSPGPVERAVSFGAIDGGDPAHVAEAAEVIILCVPSSPQVAEVVDAMLPALGTGQVVVDCSTIDPEVSRAQHERVGATGAGFLDASVNGSDAFFLTDSSLAFGDPGSFDVYDAREGGGFPTPPNFIACEGDACQPLPEAPEDPTPGTLVPNAGNPPPRFIKVGAKGKKKHHKGHKKHKSKQKNKGKKSGGKR